MFSQTSPLPPAPAVPAVPALPAAPDAPACPALPPVPPWPLPATPPLPALPPTPPCPPLLAPPALTPASPPSVPPVPTIPPVPDARVPTSSKVHPEQSASPIHASAHSLMASKYSAGAIWRVQKGSRGLETQRAASWLATSRDAQRPRMPRSRCETGGCRVGRTSQATPRTRSRARSTSVSQGLVPADISVRYILKPRNLVGIRRRRQALAGHPDQVRCRCPSRCRWRPRRRGGRFADSVMGTLGSVGPWPRARIPGRRGPLRRRRSG